MTTENVLTAVSTLVEAGVASLENTSAIFKVANKQLKEFENQPANRGRAIQIAVPMRFLSNPGLVVNGAATPIIQEQVTLQVGGYLSNGSYNPTAPNASYDENGNLCEIHSFSQFTSTDLIYYFDKKNPTQLIKSIQGAIGELKSTIESNLQARFNTDCYKFWCAGVDANNQIIPITSYKQLDQARQLMVSDGAGSLDYDVIIPNTATSEIIGNGLNNFILKRNDEVFNTWELGEFGGQKYYQSNLLPIHNAGTVGNSGTILTITGVQTDSDNAVTGFTCSGVSTTPDPNLLKKNDLGFVKDEVGKLELRYLTRYGHFPTERNIQFSVAADAGSTGSSGSVTFTIKNKLYTQIGPLQNVNITDPNLLVGRKIQILPSHRAGAQMVGKPFYLGMPMMGDNMPYYTSYVRDPETGIALRAYFGSVGYGSNIQGIVIDQMYGAKIIDYLFQKLVFPVYGQTGNMR